jgi:hypothetical protein
MPTTIWVDTEVPVNHNINAMPILSCKDGTGEVRANGV